MRTKMTDAQYRLYTELFASDQGFIYISGPQLRPAQTLVDNGKADTIGCRNPDTDQRTQPWHGSWCWTLESPASNYFKQPNN